MPVGEAGEGRGATTYKVSVNETARLDGHTEAVEVRPNLRHKELHVPKLFESTHSCLLFHMHMLNL